MTFKKGHPGGPGRPRGSRNKTTLLLEAVNQESLTRALQALGKKAEDGDIAALKLLPPAWLRQAGDFVEVDLPRVVDAASLAEAQAVLIGQERVAPAVMTPRFLKAAALHRQSEPIGPDLSNLTEREPQILFRKYWNLWVPTPEGYVPARELSERDWETVDFDYVPPREPEPAPDAE